MAYHGFIVNALRLLSLHLALEGHVFALVEPPEKIFFALLDKCFIDFLLEIDRLGADQAEIGHDDREQPHGIELNELHFLNEVLVEARHRNEYGAFGELAEHF